MQQAAHQGAARIAGKANTCQFCVSYGTTENHYHSLSYSLETDIILNTVYKHIYRAQPNCEQEEELI